MEIQNPLYFIYQVTLLSKYGSRAFCGPGSVLSPGGAEVYGTSVCGGQRGNYKRLTVCESLVVTGVELKEQGGKCDRVLI